MKIFQLFSFALLATMATGCASIVSGSNQSISVETRKNGVQVTNANCKLSNDKGTWFVNTPGSVMVNRSYTDMTVRCEKADLSPGVLSIKSTTKGMAFGNIIFGGVIGAGVDMSTGAAYDYPSLFTIEMEDLVSAVDNISSAPINDTPPGPILETVPVATKE